MAIQLQRGFDLGPRWHRLRNVADNVVRLADDLRRCVLFIGQLSADKTKFESQGSAFLLDYEGYGYLVTAGHIAESLGDLPVEVRVNKTDGSATIMVADADMDPTSPRWFISQEPTVDLAILPCHLDIQRNGLDAVFLNAASWVFNRAEQLDIGCGDFCYAVGLFRLMQGNRRNLPIVHTGNIAMMPSTTDLIPVGSRTNPDKVVHIEGYLAEMTNLDGLSGSPVFVRTEATFDRQPFPGGPPDAALPRAMVYLLGVWQGSWEGEARSHLNRRPHERVPVGMGIVVPAEKLRGLLERDDVKAERAARMARWGAAVEDGA